MSRRAVGYLVLAILIVGLPLLFFGWLTVANLRDSAERRAAERSTRCWILRIDYDGVRQRGRITYRCPRPSGGADDVELPVSWDDLKEEVRRH